MRQLIPICALLLTFPIAATAKKPDFADYPYGSHERQVFDLWQAESKGPAPLLVLIHGGGFRSGDKARYADAKLLHAALANGISVMAMNYRLIPDTRYPDPLDDAARAIQTVRAMADDFGIDPDRIVASGTSAGGIMALWTGFHDDLRSPEAKDPVERQSTRLTGVIVVATPVTFERDAVASIVGEEMLAHSLFKGPWFGLSPDAMEGLQGDRILKDFSPVSHLDAGDPPVFAMYKGSRNPADPGLSVLDRVHHYAFGEYLKQQMDAAGVTCSLYHEDELEDVTRAQIAFLNDLFSK